MNTSATVFSHAFSQAFAKAWEKNPVLSGLLGLCPLLAVSTNVASSLMLSVGTLGVLMISMTLLRLFRSLNHPLIRLPLFMLYIGFSTVMLQLLLKAWSYPLALSIGIFLPLIITNCLVLAQAEIAYQKNPSLWASLKDAFRLAFGFFLVAMILGALREFLGTGHLFVGVSSLLPFWGDVSFQSSFSGIPLAILPPGAFFLLAFLMVLRRVIIR